MAKIQRFEDIVSWQKARQLTQLVYQYSNGPKFRADFGLRDQIRRAAVSVMSSIAEGFERGGDKEFIQFLSQAKGSCGEVRSQLYVASDQGYLIPSQFNEITEIAVETSKVISGFMGYLHQSPLRGPKFKE